MTKKEEREARKALDKVITLMSGSNWVNLGKSGFRLDTAKYGSLNLKFEPRDKEDLGIKSSTTILKIYYGQNEKYRLIGIRSSEKSVFHVIGYDFSFDAYSH